MHATMYIRHIEREWIEKRIKQENITLSAVYHEAQKKKKKKNFLSLVCNIFYHYLKSCAKKRNFSYC